MNCKNCGYQVSPGENFCKGCGSPVVLANEAPASNINMGVPTPPVAENPSASVSANILPTDEIKPTLGEQMSTPVSPVVPEQPISQPSPAPVFPNAPTIVNSKNNQGIPYVIAGIIIIVVAVICVFVGKALGGTNNCPETPSGNLDTDNTNNTNTNNTTPEPTPTSNTYKVILGNYSFDIPTDYVYEIIDNSLFIGNEGISWQAEIWLDDTPYTQIITYKDKIKEYYESIGAVVATYGEKSYGSTTYMAYEVAIDGQNGVLAYTKTNTNTSFAIYTINKANTIDYSILDKISSIISTAEAVDRSKASSIDSKMPQHPELNKILK